jgi:hypothetical protein
MNLALVPKILFSLRLWLTQTLVLFLVCGNLAMAHQTGNSYLTVSEADGRLQLEIDFIVRDLGNLLQAPGQPNEPPPAPDKLLSLQAPITEAIQKSLTIEVDEQAIPLEFLTQSVVLHNDGLYVRQRFSGSALPADAKFIVVRYEFFTQNDKLGRAFFKLVMRNDEISSVFDQTSSIQRFALGETKRWSTIGLFTKEGIRHIWEGADHLLFLLALLLPGLMLTIRVPHATGLQPSNRAAEKFALKVITAFTLAHSITLACSVFGWVSLPDKLIESMIALSIMVSALLNLQKRFHISHWKLAFLFGLIHGMGFANGLKELGLSSNYFLETLFAFNLGVELGQLSAVVLVALPVLLLVREAASKQRLLKYGSIGVLLTSMVWLAQRLMT